MQISTKLGSVKDVNYILLIFLIIADRPEFFRLL